MKTKNLVAAIAVALFGAVLSRAAEAGYCMVTVQSDATSNASSLRGVIEGVVNNGATSNCSMKYYDSSYKDDSCTAGTQSYYHCTNDYKHFSQGVIFETSELGGAVATITLKDVLTIDSYYDIVIGNPSLESLTDRSNEVDQARNGEEGPYGDDFLVDAGIISVSEGYEFYGYNEDFVTQYFTYDWDGASLYDYGQVVIDASGVTDLPIQCGTSFSGSVFFRGVTIVTSDYSSGDLFSETCLEDGGDVTVCKESSWDAEAGRCGPSWAVVPPGGLVIPGGGGNDDCEDADKTTWYQDGDGDGYGTDSVTTEDCERPTGYADEGGDCDDGNAAIHPGTETSCEDGADDDCDGVADCSDGDCSTANACNAVGEESDCEDGADNDADGYADCDDADCADDSACYDSGGGAGLGDDAEAECGDGIDDDGDGDIDCEDSDCASDDACSATDSDGDGETLGDGDCDDSNAEVNPGADEICLDLTDNNCDGVIDETASCVDPGIGDDPGDGDGGVTATADTAGGCGCDLKSRRRPEGSSAQALAALIPLLAAFGLRQRARAREV